MVPFILTRAFHIEWWATSYVLFFFWWGEGALLFSTFDLGLSILVIDVLPLHRSCSLLLSHFLQGRFTIT